MMDSDSLKQRVTELEAEVELLRTVINHLPNTIYAKDQHSRMVLVNRAQAELLGTDSAIGKADFDFYPSELAQKYYEDEQHIFETGDPLIDIEEQVLDAQGRVRWYLTTKIPVYDLSGNITHIAGIGRDITDRRLLQEGLKVLNEVSITLSNTASFDDLCRLAVELGHERLGFDRIGCWFIDEADPTLVRGAFGIGEDGSIRDERHIVHPIETFGVDPNSDQTVTVTHEVPLRDDCRKQVGIGWRARTFLRNGDQRIGWIVTDNLLSHESIKPYHVEILALYGALVGHLCVRKRIEETLRKSEESARSFQNDLTKLHEVSLALSGAKSLHDLCRMAVEFGHDRLGIERLAVWLIDEDKPDLLWGTYGTDEAGYLREEYHPIHNFRELDSYATALKSDSPVVVFQDVKLYDDKSRVVGLGWSVLSSLRTFDGIVGWITADNLLSGQPFDQNAVQLLGLYGAVVGHLVVRKRADDALRESEERFRQIAENIHAVIFVRDVVHGSLLYVSPTFETVWQQPIDSLYTQPDLLDKLLVDETEFQITRPDGDLRWIAKQTFPIHDEQGKVYREVCIAEDITERKTAEQQRIELAAERKRMHVLREFIRDAYHEFRTPLSLINTKIYLAQRSGDPQRCFQNMEAIKTESNRILTLVDALVTMSRLDTDYVDEVEPLNLKLMLHDLFTALHDQSQEKNLDFQLRLPDQPIQLTGNRFELWQALHHVAENAIRYTPTDGCVTISADTEGGAIVIQVQDTGDGIPEADLDRIFERFYRRDESHTTPGFGLGLPIARKSVEKAGGTITVESESGVGSTFIIRLPLQ